MEIKPIRNEKDYQAALERVSPIFDNPPAAASTAGEEFEVMLALLDAYESKHHLIAPPDPIEAIKFRMEQMNLKVSDLVPFIGRTNRVYEILNHSRPLTLTMMQRIRDGLNISGDVLLGSPATASLTKRKAVAKRKVAANAAKPAAKKRPRASTHAG